MKILSTGSFFGSEQKFLELLGVVKILQPEVLILTGDMLHPIKTESDLEIQLDSINNYVNYLEKYSKYCQYILYIAGESESVLTHNKLEKTIDDKLKMVHCLNNKNFKFKNKHFIGLPYIRDVENIKFKDWVRADSNFVCYNTDNMLLTKNDKVIKEDKLSNEMSDKDNINIILKNKINNCNKKEDEELILVTHFSPPLKQNYVGIDTITCLHEYVKDFKYIFSGHNTDFIYTTNYWNYDINGVKLYNSSQIKELLLYVYLIEDKNELYEYHPLDSRPEVIISNVVKYKIISENKEIETKGLGDSVANFLHTGIVGKVVKSITGKDEGCLPCKRRQELLNKIISYK